MLKHTFTHLEAIQKNQLSPQTCTLDYFFGLCEEAREDHRDTRRPTSRCEIRAKHPGGIANLIPLPPLHSASY